MNASSISDEISSLHKYRAARFEEEVRPMEMNAIQEGRRLRYDGDGEVGNVKFERPDGEREALRLSALAFSGGGMRSAIFNLGIIQGLAQLGLLRRFDYLSVNSGGGYIGSWLTAWIRREGIREVESQLRNEASGPRAHAEAAPVAYLRRFGNDLTPRIGFFSIDTWTVGANYLWNLLLNQAVLVLILAAIAVAPRVLVLASSWFVQFSFWVPLNCGIACLAVMITLTVFGLRELMIPRRNSYRPWYARQTGIQAGVILPLFVAAWLFGLWMWFSQAGDQIFLHDWLAAHWAWYRFSDFHQKLFEPIAWALLGSVIYLLTWIVGIGLLVLLVRGRKEMSAIWSRRARWLRTMLLTAPLAGAVGAFLLWTVALLSNVLKTALEPAGYVDSSPWYLLHVTALGAPAITTVVILTAVVHIGLIGEAFPDALRQWWGRLGAWLLIWTVTWLGILYGPILLVLMGVVVSAALGGGWITSTVGGMLLGWRTGETGDKLRMWRRVIIAVAPYVFIVGMFASIALGVHALLDPPEEYLQPDCREFWVEAPSRGMNDDPMATVFDTGRQYDILRCHTERFYLGTTRRFASEGLGTQDGNPLVILLIFLLLATAALTLSWRVGINEFSMYLFYRNRLVRAFLGASHKNRNPDPLTGFDSADEIALTTLSPFVYLGGQSYDGPFPLFNASLNMGSGDDAPSSKAASFVFTPLFSGFHTKGATEADTQLQPAGYRPTRGYRQILDGGIPLGTAMVISGATANPSIGGRMSSAMAFMLTFFNFRSGWWLGNPRHNRTWDRVNPKLSIAALAAELFGMTNNRSRYVHLSDGRHVDNLGLYELIRRRCRFIVVSDAGVDPDLRFKDLGKTVRKCRTDFGVEIEINPNRIHRNPETGLSQWHCAVGNIHYDRVDGGPPGLLVYMKASLTGDEPFDVQAYAAEDGKFPHQPTSDPRFSDSQFESYRKLGEHVVLSVFGAIDGRPAELSWEDLHSRLSQTWCSRSHVPQGTPSS